ncbi:hypothetical protein [Nonomuraea rubra]|uniref:hypothetical protein n=1 Tax=Nonomuraea rubra TaxID=46180 RepID=UPI0033C7753B
MVPTPRIQAAVVLLTSRSFSAEAGRTSASRARMSPLGTREKMRAEVHPGDRAEDD